MRYNQEVESFIRTVVERARGSARLLGDGEASWKCEALLLSSEGERITLEVWSNSNDKSIQLRLASFSGTLMTSRLTSSSDIKMATGKILRRIGYQKGVGR